MTDHRVGTPYELILEPGPGTEGHFAHNRYSELESETGGSGHLRTFLGIGLLGSYTTFSTMALEGVQLIEVGRLGLAAGYWIATLVIGQMAGVFGMWLGRLRIPRWKET